MDKPKGGRGHTAPYETKQMRVPVRLEPQIHELIDRFRNWIANSCPSGIGNEPPKLLDKPVDNLKDERNSLEQEVNQLHSINGELNLEIAELKEKLKAVDKFWKAKLSLAEERLQEVERSRHKTQSMPAVNLEAIALLQEALKLPANTGGVIKKKIKAALEIIGQV